MVDRTGLFPAYQKAVNALTGLAFRKAPSIQNEIKAIQPELADLDLRGNSIELLAMDVFQNCLITSRGAFYPAIGTSLVNGRQVDRFYWKYCDATDIISWHRDPVTRELEWIIIREVEYQQNANFEVQAVTLYRIYRMTPDGVTLRIDSDASEGEEVPFNDSKGLPLAEIPVIVHDLGNDEAPTPVLLGLADENLNHYRMQADFQHNLHWASITQFAVSGLPEGVTTETLQLWRKRSVGSREGWRASRLESPPGLVWNSRDRR